MKDFINAKNAFNPNLEVFRTNEIVRILKEERSAVILKNVAIFDLTDTEKEILGAKIGEDVVNWKRVSTMPHYEKEISSLENTFFKPESEKFKPDSLIHFFYVRSSSEAAVEKALDNDGNNLTLVNLCFSKEISVCKLKYDENTPVVSFSSILELDGIVDDNGEPILPPIGNPNHTTESIAKKGIFKKYI